MDIERPPHPTRFASVSAVVEISLVPLALWIERLWPLERKLVLAWDPEALVLGAVGTIPPIAFLLWMISPGRREMGFLRKVRLVIRDVAGPTIAGLRWWHIPVISIPAGIGEEVLFRGVLQPRIGLLLASLIFGLLHPFTLAYVMIAGILGAYFGWLQSVQGNVLAPVIAHALYDVAALIVLRREMRAPPLEGEPGPEGPGRE